jgi:hypothetical protein
MGETLRGAHNEATPLAQSILRNAVGDLLLE